MNVKEIGKELMGKSLNSYHRRTGLTQLEENNKMQDKILDGILSQVDDAYIEKTEQSNVIHLDGSGDGVVVLDNIEGNTLVNIVKSYNTNDFVYSNAIMQSDGYFKIQYGIDVNTSYVRPKLGIHTYKPNTKYTVIVDIKENTCGKKLGMSAIHSAIQTLSPRDFSNTLGISTSVITTRSDINVDDKGNPTRYDLYFGIWEEDGGDLSKHITFRYWILEGDWTNKELPPYFQGLQSSFEEKVNSEGKHEIEILLNNKNLIDNNKGYQSSYASWIPNIGSLNNIVTTDTYNATFNNRGVGFLVKDLKPNTQYTLSIPSLLTNNRLSYALYRDENGISSWKNYIQGQGNITTNKITFTTPNEKTVAVVGVYGSYEVLYNNGASDGTVTIGNYRKLQLEVGNKNTEFNLQKQNKIKLLLNEPLRGTNVSKDMLRIKDGKLVVERRYKQLVLNGNNTEKWSLWKDNSKTYRWNNITDIASSRYVGDMMCDKIPRGEFHRWWDLNPTLGIDYGDPNGLTGISSIYICNPNIDENVTSLRQWLSENNLQVVLPLKEPIYEEILNEYGEPIILEGYENGTLYIDSTVIPTTTVRYTPKMESFKILKEVNKNNNLIALDINDNIIPYMMDVDLMIMEKEMALPSQINIRKMEALDMTSMQKRTQDMLERLIKGKTLTEQECKTRVTTYLNAGKITDAQAEELMLLISEVYA